MVPVHQDRSGAGSMRPLCERVSDGRRTVQRTEEDRAPKASEDPDEVGARKLGGGWVWFLWLDVVGVQGAVGFGV